MRRSSQKLHDALLQIAILAEFGTSGPDTIPPCQSKGLKAAQATSLRGAISQLAREALNEKIREPTLVGLDDLKERFP